MPTACSGGGPVIAVPAELALRWRGTLPPIGTAVPPGWRWGDLGGPECDYDRVCDHAIYTRTELGGAALIAIGDGHGIALDGELGSAWLPLPDGGAIWRNGVTTEAAGHAQLARVTRWTELGTIALGDGAIFLFDSAYEGAADPAAIRARDGVVVGRPGPGSYRVALGTAGEDDLIRLTRVARRVRDSKRAGSR